MKNHKFIAVFHLHLAHQFRRLPFGIASAPEEFQTINNAVFGSIPNVFVYFGDIFIATETAEEEHDEFLTNVINKARQMNLKFNLD